MIRFDDPLILWLAPLGAAFVLGLAIWARAVRVRHARRWSRALWRRSARVGRYGAVLLALAAGTVVIGVAGPRWGSQVVTTESKALNVVLAVDVSRSMLAEDMSPSRLERAKEQARRLVYQLRGDRIGLVAFAGQSFILSPLTVDAGALNLLIDALDPDLTSAGGTELARVLVQGRDLLFPGEPVADRVLIVFTDGEAHDSLPTVRSAAQRLRRDGVRLVLVAQGGQEPVTIPVRDSDGTMIGPQRDPAGEIVRTSRRSDLLEAIADEAHGVVVPAELGDQAGAVRDLIEGYKRSPQATSTADQDISRAWILALVAAVLLFGHTVTRRSMALAALVLSVGGGRQLVAQGPVNAADQAWSAGDVRRAAELYLEQVRSAKGGERAWFNLGTAAMALGDTATASQALDRVARSLDPDLRFRALYNLGLLALRAGLRDPAAREEQMAIARQRYREALLLRPHDRDAKWNLELAVRMTPPPAAGGGSGPTSGGGGGGEAEEAPAALSPGQAEQILNSMAEEERRTILDRNRRRQQGREVRGWRDW